MPRIQRMGDSNDDGGIITNISQSSVFANDFPIAIQGSLGSDHDGCPLDAAHCYGNWHVNVTNDSNTFAEDQRVAVEGDVDTCGHIRIDGSTDVFAG